MSDTPDYSQYKTGVKPSTKEEFYEMLGVLPPESLTTIEGNTSFKIAEYYIAYITDIYICYKGKYYTLRDSAFKSHKSIIKMVEEFNAVTYCITRFYEDDEKQSETIETGLTLEEAQAHCQSEETHGDGWFDGYNKE